MLGELAARRLVVLSLVSMQSALARQVGDEGVADFGASQVLDLDRAGTTAALDQREDFVLRAGAARLPALAVHKHVVRRAEEGFVSLDHLPFATKRAGAALTHGFPNPVREEPSRLVSDVEGAVELVRGDAFLARCHEAKAHEPLVKRNMAALEERADPYRELLPAFRAVVPARPHAFAAQGPDVIEKAAEGAERAIGPAHAFEILTGSLFVVKGGVAEFDRGHGTPPVPG